MSPLSVSLPELSFEDYVRDSPSVSRVSDINGFQVRLEIPPFGRWRDERRSESLTGRLHDAMREVLKSTGIYRSDAINVTVGNSVAEVDFQDEEFGFQITVTNDGNISLERQGSSFRRFHQWYVKVMPAMANTASKLTQALADEAATAQGIQRDFPILRARINFHFIAFDLTDPGGRTIRNHEVMNELLGRWPLQSGEASRAARVDVSYSRWRHLDEEAGGSRYREAFSIEAPANRAWTTLWFGFTCIGETYIGPDGTREEFDWRQFLQDPTIPYVDFLRDTALSDFFQNVMGDRNFRLAPGVVP